MPWIGTAPNKQYQRTDGTRSGTDVFQQEQAAAIGILSVNLDTHANDFANALSLCITRDGGTAMAADLVMSNHKITGLAAGVSGTDAANVAQTLPAGVKMLFYASTAPAGWTQVTTGVDNSAIRVVAGAGGTAGGSVDFSTAFTSRSVAGTISGTAITVAQMPSHGHAVTDPGHVHTSFGAAYVVSGGAGVSVLATSWGGINTASSTTGISIQNNGSGATHDHVFTGTAMDLSVKYLNTILCTKN